jgi:hypothetical protein
MSFGIHLHFTRMDYSVVKYGTNTKSAIAKFDSLSTEQKYKFEWLATKFGNNTQDIVYACIASEFANLSVQFSPKEEIVGAYYKFKARRESMSYSLKSEVQKYLDLPDKNIDKIIVKYLVQEYSPEFILVLCDGSDNLSRLYSSPNFAWAKNNIMKVIKYESFFNTKKYTSLLAPE